MIWIYLKSAWRNAIATPAHTLVNLVGLAVGLATFILIMLTVQYELAWNHGFANHASLNLVRMGTTVDGRRAVVPSEPIETAAFLKLDFPQVDAVTRAVSGYVILETKDAISSELAALTVDPNFLEVVGIPLLRGDPATALKEPGTLIIDRALALKHFGSIDCVGQILIRDGQDDVRVTGVFDLPRNTNFDERAFLSGAGADSVLAKYDGAPQSKELPDGLSTFALILSDTVRGQIESGLDGFGANHFRYWHESQQASFMLMPLDSWHLDGKRWGERDSGPLNRFIAMNAIAVLILSVAAINYINLATALADRRWVEVGVRKAIGASRGQMVTQFLTESVCLSMAATLLGTAIVETVLPYWNALQDATIRFDYLGDLRELLLLVSFAAVFGLAAGLYPALFLSGCAPAAALRSGRSRNSRKMFRQGLAIFQYAASITMIIAAVVIYSQNSYIFNEILGIEDQYIVNIMPPPGTRWWGTSPEKNDFTPRMVDLLKALPGVQAVTSSPDDVSWAFHLPGQPAPNAKFFNARVDGGHYSVIGQRAVAGRLFDWDHADANGAILNQTAVKAFGFASPEDAIGQDIVGVDADDGTPEHRVTIIGVVRDYMMVLDPFDKIPPMVTLKAVHPETGAVDARLTGTNIPETLTAIDKAYASITGRSFASREFWRDMSWRNMLIPETKSVGIFALVATFIATLGLFGLAEFMAERRTKEIGIRKAMGASRTDIVRRMAMEFLWPAAMANLLAWPLAYLAMDNWLNGFAYRTSLNPFVFLGVSLLVLALAAAATLFHTLKVARAKPVTALRYE